MISSQALCRKLRKMGERRLETVLEKKRLCNPDTTSRKEHLWRRSHNSTMPGGLNLARCYCYAHDQTAWNWISADKFQNTIPGWWKCRYVISLGKSTYPQILLFVCGRQSNKQKLRMLNFLLYFTSFHISFSYYLFISIVIFLRSGVF